MNAILINQLHKVFRGKRGGRVEALCGISLAVEGGEVFGFLGPNGAGKSTTIKCLMGLIRPTSGAAAIGGAIAGSLEARRHIGYLPENPAFYDFLTAQEYLGFVGGVCSMNSKHLKERSTEVLRKLELWDARKRPIRSYSKGMVQRLGLAQTLLHDPDIYILDEPMSGLDPLGRALVKEIILELKTSGKTVFFSTHILDDVEKICDRAAIILKGEVLYCGAVQHALMEGISCYQVQVRNLLNGSERSLEIAKDMLETALGELRQAGEEVLLIEPRKRHLEDFFLDIVKHV